MDSSIDKQIFGAIVGWIWIIKPLYSMLVISVHLAGSYLQCIPISNVNKFVQKVGRYVNKKKKKNSQHYFAHNLGENAC